MWTWRFNPHLHLLSHFFHSPFCHASSAWRTEVIIFSFKSLLHESSGCMHVRSRMAFALYLHPITVFNCALNCASRGSWSIHIERFGRPCVWIYTICSGWSLVVATNDRLCINRGFNKDSPFIKGVLLAFVRGPEGLFGYLTLCCHFSFSPFDFRHDHCCQSDQVITHCLGKTCVVIAPGVVKLLRFLGPMSWYDVVSVRLSCPAWFMDVLLLVVPG